MISGAVYAAGNTSTCEHLLQSKCHYTRCPTKGVCSVAIRYILRYNKAVRAIVAADVLVTKPKVDKLQITICSKHDILPAQQAGKFTRSKADI